MKNINLNLYFVIIPNNQLSFKSKLIISFIVIIITCFNATRPQNPIITFLFLKNQNFNHGSVLL